ncbi:MAG: hypothetical protein JXQ27_17105 [Acidobacteria bacterium]|nr:hypothetical protein [Acidobacteriota bacterium]
MYGIDGPGLAAQGIHLHPARRGMDVVNLEIGHTPNIRWNSFRMTRRGRKRLEREEGITLIEESMVPNAMNVLQPSLVGRIFRPLPLPTGST